jgi:ClpX C4-type zinc finger
MADGITLLLRHQPFIAPVIGNNMRFAGFLNIITGVVRKIMPQVKSDPIKIYHCSFCQVREDKVKYIVGSSISGATICNSCLNLAALELMVKAARERQG